MGLSAKPPLLFPYLIIDYVPLHSVSLFNSFSNDFVQKSYEILHSHTFCENPPANCNLISLFYTFCYVLDNPLTCFTYFVLISYIPLRSVYILTHSTHETENHFLIFLRSDTF